MKKRFEYVKTCCEISYSIDKIEGTLEKISREDAIRAMAYKHFTKDKSIVLWQDTSEEAIFSVAAATEKIAKIEEEMALLTTKIVELYEEEMLIICFPAPE